MKRIEFLERILDLNESIREHLNYQLQIIEDIESDDKLSNNYLSNFLENMDIRLDHLRLIDKKIKSLESTKLGFFDIKGKIGIKTSKLFFTNTLSFYNGIIEFLLEKRSV